MHICDAQCPGTTLALTLHIGKGAARAFITSPATASHAHLPILRTFAKLAKLCYCLMHRTTEADQWAARGRAYYEGAAGLNTQPIEATLGQLDTLKQGGGDPGRGCLLNLTLRRVLPMAPQK